MWTRRLQAGAKMRAKIMLRAGASVKKPITGPANCNLMTGEPEIPRDDRPKFRLIIHWRIIVLGWIVGLLVHVDDYRPDDIALATAPYRFSAISWELGNLPDKWLRRAMRTPRALFGIGGDDRHNVGFAEVNAYFDRSRLIRRIDLHLIRLAALPSVPSDLAASAEEMRQGRINLREKQARMRPAVEETVESAVADTLQSLGFQAWTGVFPPVDTVLTGSPTVLITSPRDRIARGDDVVLRTGLTNDERERIESRVEAQTELSALVVNTGGIAFYPSITRPDFGLDFTLEVIAHEWVHQWLWFRPLGKRYFDGGEMTVINETVADIAGQEIGALARHRLEGTEPPPPTPSPRTNRRTPTTLPPTTRSISTSRTKCGPPGSALKNCWRPAKLRPPKRTWRNAAGSSWTMATSSDG